jgi:LmbE family N-acetylglucosaminyl deacetylase
MAGLLVLLAHPDDEFFCAGLLAALAARRVPIHFAYWTRGEGGGSPRRRLLAGLLPHEWRPRVREARHSAAIFGATVDFLGAVDPAPNPHQRAPEDPEETFARRLEPVLQKRGPELILTHGSAGEYGHPAHRRLHQLVGPMAERASYPLLSFAAAAPEVRPAPFINAHDAAHLVLDGALWQKQKAAVLQAHRSQNGVFEALAGGAPGDFADLTRFEGYRAWHKVASAVSQLVDWLGPESPVTTHRV